MSWNKNTISISKLDAVLETLDNLGVPYELSTIGEFVGRGLNDGWDTAMHYLRRLKYKDRVILEYAELDADCDVDDIIASAEFKIEDEPGDWQAVRHTDKFGNCGEEV